MSEGYWQRRGRFVWVTLHAGGTTVWFHLGGRKPLAHLPRWRRRLFHLPSVRVRLWPRPFRRYARAPGPQVEALILAPDHSQAWERGWEWTSSEGSPVWRRLREDRGLSREQLHEACRWEALHPATQELIESALAWPEPEEFAWYARLAGTSPGELLDRVLVEAAERIAE